MYSSVRQFVMRHFVKCASFCLSIWSDLGTRVAVQVVTDVLADVQVDSARLHDVQVLGADARQPEVDTEQHQHRLHRDLLVGAHHCPQPLHRQDPARDRQLRDDLIVNR